MSSFWKFAYFLLVVCGSAFALVVIMAGVLIDLEDAGVKYESLAAVAYIVGIAIIYWLGYFARVVYDE